MLKSLAVIEKFLNNTYFVVAICVLFLFVALGVNRSLFDLVKVKQVENMMTEEISTIEVKSKAIKEKLEFVNDPKFVEKKIREQFDAGDGDLVFIFSDTE